MDARVGGVVAIERLLTSLRMPLRVGRAATLRVLAVIVASAYLRRHDSTS